MLAVILGKLVIKVYSIVSLPIVHSLQLMK